MKQNIKLCTQINHFKDIDAFLATFILRQATVKLTVDLKWSSEFQENRSANPSVRQSNWRSQWMRQEAEIVNVATLSSYMSKMEQFLLTFSVADFFFHLISSGDRAQRLIKCQYKQCGIPDLSDELAGCEKFVFSCVMEDHQFF